MAYPNTSWQTNPLLMSKDPTIDFNPAPVQGPVQNMSQTPAAAPYPTGGSSAAPTPVAAPVPTIGETLNGIKTEALRVQDILNQQNKAKTGLTAPTYDNYPTYAELNPKINEKQIQRNQMKLFQKEIDATNKVYGDLLNTERLAGQGRLGTQTAMAARGGLLGSDFGEAQRQNQEGLNQQAQQAVQNERLAKIGTIMGTMRKAVSDEIENKRKARTEDANSYISYLAGAKTRKQENLKLAASALIDSGIDPNTMTPDELAAIGKEANLSAQDILMQYRQQKAEQDIAAEDRTMKTNKGQADIDKIKNDITRSGDYTLSEGQARYENGAMVASRAKTYAPSTGSGSGLKIGGQSVDPSTVSSTHQKLDGLRGEDGYTDTAKYQQELGSFVDLGGDPKDFVKEFDPNIYINPNDETRSYLQAYMKKTPEEQALTDLEEFEASAKVLQDLRANGG